MIIKITILTIIWLLIIPCFIGLNIIKYANKEDKNIFLAYIVGMLIEFLSFEILAIPFTFVKFSFRSLTYTWVVVILIIFGLSIYFNKDNFKSILKVNVEKIKIMPKILSVIFLILLFFQAYMSFNYMYEDYDDSNFVAKITIARDTNTLFVYDDMGIKYDKFPTRHVFSPFPYYTATISELIDCHPAIVAHTIFPVIFLILGYIVFYLIGNSLFKNDKNKTMVFMVILSILYIFGKYSRYAIFIRLLGRAWQGKSLLANIIIPFIMYLFLEYLEDNQKCKFFWIMLFITLWAADLLSSMSIFLPIIAAGILVVLYAIKDKDIKYIFSFIPCCLPSVVYGILYLIIK